MGSAKGERYAQKRRVCAWLARNRHRYSRRAVWNDYAVFVIGVEAGTQGVDRTPHPMESAEPEIASLTGGEEVTRFADNRLSDRFSKDEARAKKIHGAGETRF